MIEFRNVSVGYHSHILIKGINFTVESGQTAVLIGPNGSGKSTVLKSLLRQIPLCAGEIFIDDKSIKDISEAKYAKMVSAVLTKRIRTEYMSGYDVAAQGRSPYTAQTGSLRESDIEAVEKAFYLLGIEELGNKDYSTMSDGQKQLVMIARSLAQDTPIMVLDEPENHLDIGYKLRVLSALYTLAREENKCIIASLHDISLAGAFADKVMCVTAEHNYSFGGSDEILNEKKISELFSVNRDTLEGRFKEMRIV